MKCGCRNMLDISKVKDKTIFCVECRRVYRDSNGTWYYAGVWRLFEMPGIG